MDTKRLILAVGLSMLIIIGYQYFFGPKPQPQVSQPTQTSPGNLKPGETPAQNQKGDSGLTDIFSKKKDSAVIPAEAAAGGVKENITGTEVKDVIVENNLYKAVFTSKGAGLKSFILKDYKDDSKKIMDLVSTKVNEKYDKNVEVYPLYFSPFEDENRETLIEVNRSNFAFTGNSYRKIDNENISIEFNYSDVGKNLKVVKRFTFTKDSYVIKIDCQVIKDGKTIDSPILFGPDIENNRDMNRNFQTELGIGHYNGNGMERLEFAKVNTQKINDQVEIGKGIVGSNFYWVSFDTTYFAAMFKTTEKIQYAVVKKWEKDVKKTYSYVMVSNPKNLLMFLGPKNEKILANLEKYEQFVGAHYVVNYGNFLGLGFIVRWLHAGITWVNSFIPNVGWALIVFTLLIKILLFPLTYASSVSMGKVQALQPKINAIKKKYKNMRDPEQRRQMQIETMALYKQEKVNPAGGCLPMLLQMPILIAFFNLIPVSITFRHEPWILWLSDLSIKDPFYVLPILMGVTQIIVSKMSPTSGDSSQKALIYIMPIVFTFLFLNYCSGLNLYWVVSNVLQIGQQYFINKKVFAEKKEEEKERRALKKKKGGKVL